MKVVIAATSAAMVLGAALGAITAQRVQAQAKPPVYLVVENEINDVQNYLKEYAPRARDMIKAIGGRYLAAGEATTFAGDPPKSRVAIFMFDDIEKIRAWYGSAEYKELKKIGDKYAKFRNYVVPGLAQ